MERCHSDVVVGAHGPGSPKGAALSRALARRSRAGPPEQVKSYASRLRNTRCCEIQHSSMEEPLSCFKSLEPLRPNWPHSHRRFHIKDGVRVLDNETVVVDAKDRCIRTMKGQVRSSTGSVTYSATHLMKLELDVQDLAKILTGDCPGGGYAWSPKRLAHVFKERTGRAGCWATYELSFMAFLSLFPRTFEIFGDGQYVRLRAGLKGCASLLDTAQEAIIRLARARGGQERRERDEEEHGETVNVSTLARRGGGVHALYLPDLETNRLKTTYLGHKDTMSLSAYTDNVPSQVFNMTRAASTGGLEFSSGFGSPMRKGGGFRSPGQGPRWTAA